MQANTERETYLQVLEQMIPWAQQLSSDTMTARVSALAESVRSGEILIPVVGTYSAGKSTLLNTLLGRPVLPTSLRPETALATELHFSETEFIEAFDEREQMQRFELAQYGEINSNAAHYTHLKVYLNSPFLRELEPAVLVDMPGFDSPLDLHNRAINYYLDKGALYLVLVSSQDGTVTASMLRQLDKIAGYGCPFSVFVSKGDLLTERDLKQVVATVQSQLSLNFWGQKFKIGTVNNQSAEQVSALLNSIDCNELFKRKFLPSLLQVGQALSTELKLQAKLLEAKAQEKVAQVVKVLDDAIAELSQKQQTMKANLETQFNLEQLQQEVLSQIEASLSDPDHADEFMAQVIAGDQDKAQAIFDDVVHAAVVNALKGKLDEIDQQIFEQCQATMGTIDQTLKEDCVSSQELCEQVSQLAQTNLDLSQISQELPLAGMRDTAKQLSQMLTTGLKGVASLKIQGVKKFMIGGLMDVVNHILPTLLTMLLNKVGSLTAQAQINQVMDSMIIPQVMSSLKPEVQNLLTQEVNHKLDLVTRSFTQAIAEKQVSLRAVMEQQQNTEALPGKVNELRQAASQLDELLQPLS